MKTICFLSYSILSRMLLMKYTRTDLYLRNLFRCLIWHMSDVITKHFIWLRFWQNNKVSLMSIIYEYTQLIFGSYWGEENGWLVVRDSRAHYQRLAFHSAGLSSILGQNFYWKNCFSCVSTFYLLSFICWKCLVRPRSNFFSITHSITQRKKSLNYPPFNHPKCWLYFRIQKKQLEGMALTPDSQ